MVERDRFHILFVEDEPNIPPNDVIPKWVEEALTKFSWRGTEFDAALVSWTLVESTAAATREMAAAEQARPGRGFDALICDLKIPQDDGSAKKHEKHGMAVLEKRREYDWPGAVIVTSNYADLDDVLLEREARRQGLHYDEWLKKDHFTTNVPRGSTIAKLQRHLVPVHWYARTLSHVEPQQDGAFGPVLFHGPQMRRVLRDLVGIAHRPACNWPLTKLLLLGDSGSGKGAVVRALARLLPRDSETLPRRVITVNCASLVAQAHGGRIALFGCDNFQGVGSQAGFFERATAYSKYRKMDAKNAHPDGSAKKDAMDEYTRSRSLAATDAKIAWDSASVVFLDEFAELNQELQASILNALEEGRIRREGSLEEIPIGCHVVCATNASVESLLGHGSEHGGSGRVRHDLLDRIPDVLYIPSLVSRRGEIKALIQHLAADRLRRLGVSPEPLPEEISITEPALRTISWAVEQRLIRSVRHLQAIAAISAEERHITDGNLGALIAKARLLRKDREIGALPDDLRVSEQARLLQFPEDLHVDDLPVTTTAAIRIVYQRFVGVERVFDLVDVQVEGMNPEQNKEIGNRVKLLSLFFDPQTREQLYAESEGALRMARHRMLQSRMPTVGNGPNKTEPTLAVLLND